MKRKHKSKPSIPPPTHRGSRARAGGQTLRTWTVGAVPLVNQLLERIRLEEFLRQHLPKDGRRMAVPTSRCLLLLLRNVLLSREPIYGLGEWAERFAPDLLGLRDEDLDHLNDDRIGRSLDRLFQANVPCLVLDVVRHVVKEFDVSLDELHNDSTTISFYGAYESAQEEQKRGTKQRLAMLLGHSKDHRPDLKQLLYILTVTEDGGVPIYFTAASGNVTDDTTHRETWDLLRQLTDRVDFLYVADSKLATRENMQYIHNQGGRFITILPRTRREDREFRRRLAAAPDALAWEHLYDMLDDEQAVVDRLRVCAEPSLSSEGYRLLWYHSTRKAQRDGMSRTKAIERACRELAELQSRLQGARTRFRTRDKVEAAVAQVLCRGDVHRWVKVTIHEAPQEQFKQATRGRPGKETRYVKEVRVRYRLTWELETSQIEEDEITDGVFPLVTNQHEMPAAEVLKAYKRQPLIEKRFSQFKSDFEVAPVYLKEVTRIQSLLCIYFFALMVQTLLERELRGALEASGYDTIPLYPEHRDCSAPTTRRILDIFDNVQRHTLSGGTGEPQMFVTQLSPLQRWIASWFDLSSRKYGR
ncbi:MAG: IS1634 family transposase [Pirellulaceae bacterium]